MNKTTQHVRFPSATLDRLFSAVEENDLFDENVSLPKNIDIRCENEQIQNNFALCLEFWQEGVSHSELCSLINNFIKQHDFQDSDRMKYKYIRARYKHLRFAQRLYSAQHKSGRLFNLTTVALGHFQDAFKNGSRAKLTYYGIILRLALSKPICAMVQNSLYNMKLDTESNFISYRQKQIIQLRELLANKLLTGKQFHNTRKIISQTISFYDTLRSIDPDNRDAYEISRFLAAINGLMGEKHDEMVADKLAGRKSYDEPAPLDTSIRERLELLIEKFSV